jgi:two-component system LytT family response regulator
MHSLHSRYLDSSTARIIPHPASQKYATLQSAHRMKIELVTHREVRFVQVDQILCCKAEGNYCSVMLSNGDRVLLSKTLKWMNGRLPEALFVRAHASWVVQLEQIATLGKDTLTLTSGEEIPVSRSRRSALKQRLKSHSNATANLADSRQF